MAKKKAARKKVAKKKATKRRRRKVTPKKQFAVGSAAVRTKSGHEGGRGEEIEAAMSAAIEEGLKEGLGDNPAELRKRMLEARERVLRGEA